MKRKVIFFAFALSVSLPLSMPARAQAPTAVPSASQATIVKAAHILDVKTGKYLDGQAMLVRKNNIEAVGTFSALQAQAHETNVIDLGPATLLPGMIDCHTHLLENYEKKYGNDDPNMALTVSGMSTASRALLGAKMNREDVEAKITTIRDVGNSS